MIVTISFDVQTGTNIGKIAISSNFFVIIWNDLLLEYISTGMVESKVFTYKSAAFRNCLHIAYKNGMLWKHVSCLFKIMCFDHLKLSTL